MTIRDPEVLEALRDEPELLALADAVAETQRTPRPPRAKRAAPRVAALVAVGLAALLAVLFWPGGGGRNGILDRALAAIGDGRVLHVVTRVPSGVELVNLQTGRTVSPTYEIETWSDRGSTRFHIVFHYGGRIVGELLYPQDRERGVSLGAVDPAYAALWLGYRQALANGEAKIERDGMLYGHPVYWLRFPPVEPHSPGSLVAIDRRSYRPLAFRFSAGSGPAIDYRVLLARTEPFSASAFQRLTRKPDPFSGASSSGETGVTPSPTPGPRKPWLLAGKTIAGLKLSDVRPMSVSSGKKTGAGFELVYGAEAPQVRSLTIEELKNPPDRSEWKDVPSGFMRIQRGEESSDARGSHAQWTGSLVLHGVYVTIDTGVSRAAVLGAARALRPA